MYFKWLHLLTETENDKLQAFKVNGKSKNEEESKEKVK